MNKFKSLLLPLALVFAALAIFEFGARYGASNTRALALAGQLQSYINMYVQALPHMDEKSESNLSAVIDNHIATAALERNAWYLKFRQEPKATLDKVLATALSVRGQNVLSHLNRVEASEEGPKLDAERVAEVRQAVQDAKAELITNAPKPVQE